MPLKQFNNTSLELCVLLPAQFMFVFTICILFSLLVIQEGKRIMKQSRHQDWKWRVCFPLQAVIYIQVFCTVFSIKLWEIASIHDWLLSSTVLTVSLSSYRHVAYKSCHTNSVWEIFSDDTITKWLYTKFKYLKYIFEKLSIKIFAPWLFPLSLWCGCRLCSRVPLY